MYVYILCLYMWDKLCYLHIKHTRYWPSMCLYIIKYVSICCSLPTYGTCKKKCNNNAPTLAQHALRCRLVRRRVLFVGCARRFVRQALALRAPGACACAHVCVLRVPAGACASCASYTIVYTSTIACTYSYVLG